jgi:Zn-dependent M28 family amino/carboxypeptidase
VKRLSALVACLAASTAAAQVRPTPAELRAAGSISEGDLRAYIRFLASDLLEGRGPGTRGDRLAQEYILAQFDLLGLEPLGDDGTYLQQFPLAGITGNPETMRLESARGLLTLRYREDFIAVAGAQRKESAVRDAEIVFVGFGIQAPEFGWDDYKGADLSGKVLLMLNSDPEDDPSQFAGKARLRYGRWDYKYEVAAKQRAAGAIILHTTPSAGYPWQVVQSSWSGTQYEIPASEGHRMEIKAWTTEDATRRLVALGGQDLDALIARAKSREFKPVPLGVKLSTSFANRLTQVKTANVLGLWRGSDPRLREEIVVYTAHHDHLGRKESAVRGEDDIFNGAVDNASGVASMLAVAKAMTRLEPRPRRSILFAAVGAEEQGLLGSEYLATHLPKPAGYFAADINIDGINFRGRTRDATMIGLGKSTLDSIVIPLARAQGRTVKPDQMPDRGFFYRSDQFNFARIGVPAVYLGSGLDYVGRPPGWGKEQRERWEAERYHQPSDEFDPNWDLSGAVEDARLYLWIGSRVANAPRMPQWRRGDEFEHIRKKALEARFRIRSKEGEIGRPPDSARR